MISCKLKDICKLVKGKQIDTSLLSENLPFKYINGGIKESGYYKEFNTKGNTIIISEGGASCGYVNYITEKFWLGCHCYKLIDVSVDSKYLFYALKANQQRIMELRTGAAMPNINKTILNELPIKISMDETEQKQIVEKFDYIERLLKIQNTILLSLDDSTKSRFMEMFEFECKTIPLEQCCVSISGGSTPSMKQASFYGGDVPFIKSGDVKETRVSSGTLWLTKDALEKGRAKLVPAGSIIVVTRSGILKHTLPVAIALNPIVINQDIKALQPSGRFLSDYLAWSIRISENILLAKSRMTTVDNIESNDLYQLPIKEASLDLQNKFSIFVEQIDKSKYDVILRIKLALFELIHSQKLFFVSC